MVEAPISKKEQVRDALLISLSGGAIGIIGAIAEGRILSQNNIDLDAAIRMGVATLAGLGLAVKGAERYIATRRVLEKGRGII